MDYQRERRNDLPMPAPDARLIATLRILRSSHSTSKISDSRAQERSRAQDLAESFTQAD
jgi:hypothetical protein